MLVYWNLFWIDEIVYGIVLEIFRKWIFRNKYVFVVYVDIFGYLFDLLVVCFY